MTTMLEKAARAIAVEWHCETDHDDPEAVAAAESQWKSFASLARAAIQAIREPSPEMVRAASESAADDGDGGNFGPLCDLLDFSGENKTRLVVAEALRKAVGAILEEKPE